jgi:hypothetical protein
MSDASSSRAQWQSCLVGAVFALCGCAASSGSGSPQTDGGPDSRTPSDGALDAPAFLRDDGGSDGQLDAQEDGQLDGAACGNDQQPCCAGSVCNGQLSCACGLCAPQSTRPKVSTLVEGFDSTTTNTQLWTTYADSGVALTQTGGRLRILLATGGPKWGTYTSKDWLDLTNSRAFVEVPEMVNTASANADAYFGADNTANNRLTWAQQGGVLYAVVTVGGERTTVASPAYDSVQQRYWQIREACGTSYFETSPDGSTWTLHASVATPAFASQVQIGLGAGTSVTDPNLGAASFDHLNGG